MRRKREKEDKKIQWKMWKNRKIKERKLGKRTEEGIKKIRIDKWRKKKRKGEKRWNMKGRKKEEQKDEFRHNGILKMSI